MSKINKQNSNTKQIQIEFGQKAHLQNENRLNLENSKDKIAKVIYLDNRTEIYKQILDRKME